MNMDQIKGKWLQMRGEAKLQWGNLTDDDWDKMDGNFDKLTGYIQEKYGYNKEKAQQEVEKFRLSMDKKYAENKEE